MLPSIFLAERVKRKLNVASPTLDNLELVEFNPPDIKLLDKLEFIKLMSYYKETNSYSNNKCILTYFSWNFKLIVPMSPSNSI